MVFSTTLTYFSSKNNGHHNQLSFAHIDVVILSWTCFISGSSNIEIAYAIVMTSLTMSRCAPWRSGTFNVIIYLMCSNEIAKNHCSNNDAILSAYTKGWHISQNFAFTLPNSKSSFYDRTEWWMEIIKWCKEPFLHRVLWINQIILSYKWTRLLH